MGVEICDSLASHTVGFFHEWQDVGDGDSNGRLLTFTRDASRHAIRSDLRGDERTWSNELAGMRAAN